MRRFAILSTLALLLAGCQPNAGMAGKPAEPKKVTLAKGTAIPLMLLAPLESGDCPVGMGVPLVVAEDVRADGEVIIPKGTAVTGTVAQSRGAGAVSAIINQPARLALDFEALETPIGNVRLTANAAKDEAEPYAFTRDNTGRPEPSAAVQSAVKDEKRKALLGELADALETGSVSEDLGKRLGEDPELQNIFKELGLAKTDEWVRQAESSQKGFDRLFSSVNALRDGDLSKLDGAELGIALAVIEEVGGLADDLNRTIRGIFKGRIIRAHVGTKLTVYTMEPLSGTVQPK
jgi:hypothetical protein